MRRRSGGVCVFSIEELAEEVSPMQLQKRDAEEQRDEIAVRQEEMQSDEFALEMDSHKPCKPLTIKKLIVLGAAGVGKTSLIRRFMTGQFTEAYEPSEG
jgi:putative ribosome biogenesis GTPase RsgA